MSSNTNQINKKQAIDKRLLADSGTSADQDLRDSWDEPDGALGAGNKQ